VSLGREQPALAPITLPHTRGGVPKHCNNQQKIINSSPHTWGCPFDVLALWWIQFLFPTHVGVSLIRFTRLFCNNSLPHTRGGVPSTANWENLSLISSPHTWGCPPMGWIYRSNERLFPTHVGVSLQLTLFQSLLTSLPHTRGGVPKKLKNQVKFQGSSPHTWGCPSIISRYSP